MDLLKIVESIFEAIENIVTAICVVLFAVISFGFYLDLRGMGVMNYLVLYGTPSVLFLISLFMVTWRVRERHFNKNKS